MYGSISRLWLFPMHGEVKVRNEGLRTRDGHLIEWFSRLGVDALHISSRPEPWPRLSIARARHRGPLPPAGAEWHSPQPLSLPSLPQRRRWWSDSASQLATWTEEAPDAVIAWNPFAVARIAAMSGPVPVLFDLLDDWTIHHQFAPIRGEVEQAYRAAFATAALVYANSPGTMRLAHRFGREDAHLLLNGVDPGRFSTASTATGRTTIGYAGKLSERLDLELIARAVTAMPDCRFVVAGPSYSRSVRRELRRMNGLELLGDVHYDEYPALLQSWDVGWVPHRVGEGGEIGGDVIKLYEYRAAGLPTFSTPLEGGGGELAGVRVAPRDELATQLEAFVEANARPRVGREPMSIPAGMTWSYKAQAMLDSLPAVSHV